MIVIKNDIFEISDKIITINLCYLVLKDYALRHTEVTVNIFSKYYKDQIIKFIAEDGENLVYTGFLNFLEHLQKMFNIPNTSIEFYSVLPVPSKYKHIPIDYSIFKKTKHYLGSIDNQVINDLQAAKFVGVLNGSRVSLNRLLMCYELGIAFPDDYHMTMGADIEDTLKFFNPFRDVYADEIAWFRQKKFVDSDLDIGELPNWRKVLPVYEKIKNLYAIEVVMETDEYNNQWLTEKSARVLAGGKPFVMLSGKDSLCFLKDLGYKTFSEVIDESYDNAVSPYARIQGIIKSLTELYTSPNKNEKILKMYEIAEYNKQAYLALTSPFQ